MRVKFVRFWCMYLFLHLIDNVSLQDSVSVEGVVGGSVILPCSYKERKLNTEEINVFWRYKRKNIFNYVKVYDIEKGKPLTEKQDAMFKGRIEGPSEDADGNFSLKLSDLRLTDEGQFLCDIPDVDKEHKLTLLVSDLFMLYQASESLTNITVTLGSDVNITCDLDIEEIYWYKLKLPDPPVLILRTFSSTYEGGKYENITYKHKYSVKTNSRLFIKNITIDELGVYYCVKTSEPPKISNGTKIYISDFVHNNITDSVDRNQTEDASQRQIPWRNMTIIFILLNVLLIIAVIGLLKSCIDATRRSKNTSEKPQNTTEAQNTNDPQYAQVDFTKLSRRNRPSQDQTTYSFLQPVKAV
ncbi:butyrophilin-like protein [Pimephales promelas]|nr:butyrophilin-like protein [Pimephales promelas]